MDVFEFSSVSGYCTSKCLSRSHLRLQQWHNIWIRVLFSSSQILHSKSWDVAKRSSTVVVFPKEFVPAKVKQMILSGLPESRRTFLCFVRACSDCWQSNFNYDCTSTFFITWLSIISLEESFSVTLPQAFNAVTAAWKAVSSYLRFKLMVHPES